MEDTPIVVFRVYRGHEDNLPLVLSPVRVQAEYRLAFAMSGICDVTVKSTDVTVVWWCDV